MIDQEKNSAVHPYELIHVLLSQVACNPTLDSKINSEGHKYLNPLRSLYSVKCPISNGTQSPPPKNVISNLKHNYSPLPDLQKVRKKAYFPTESVKARRLLLRTNTSNT